MKEKEAKLMKLIGKGKNFWRLLEESNFLLNDFVSTINSLYEKNLIRVEHNFVKPTKQSFSKKSIEGNSLLKKFKKLIKKRPKAKYEFFQGWITPADVVKRVLLMHKLDDLENKNILLVGDDDLLSVALSLTQLPKNIWVVDIDKRLGNFIKKVNSKLPIPIEFMEYDVAQPLPKKLIRKFHIFSTEPLETLSGFLAFVARGAASLKRNGAGYIGLTTCEASLKKWLRFEKAINSMNFVITDIIRGFSAYSEKHGPKEYDEWLKLLKFKVSPTSTINWYKSSLIRIEALGFPKPLIKASEKIKILLASKEDFTHPYSPKNNQL